MARESIKVRGLARIPAVLLSGWGGLVALKALYDLFAGEPEANLYAPSPWAFVTREQWLRYGGFELAYGLACLALAGYLWKYSCLLPETLDRDAALRPEN
ncbi:MAG: hypothetical protein WCU88_01445 [Elusimicrobiota bacterium]|jgi:hypothetical protein